MLDRESCERRVYRLATLLTGDPRSAARVITLVVDAQPDIRRLDSAHLDRVTVLRSREIPPRALYQTAVPASVAEAIAQLPPQQREAWVFANVYRLTERELARAMDCSVTALVVHLRAADEALARWLGRELLAAPKMLLDYSMTLDVPEFYRATQRRRRLFRRAVIIGGIALAVVVVILLLAWLASPRKPAPVPSESPVATPSGT